MSEVDEENISENIVTQEQIVEDMPETDKTFVVPARDGQTNLSDVQLREMLSPLEYAVSIESKTEKAFDNPLWDNNRE